MDDLIGFLRARLAEDEATAHGATDGPWKAWKKNGLHGLGDLIHAVATPGEMVGSRATIVTASWLDATHIARHHPARVLAEVEAKRRIVDETWGGPDHQDMWDHHVRLLALPYADHPDYREEWRP